MNNLHLFPVEINTADYETILRVPGIGVRSARRIVTARRVAQLDFESLKKLGIVLKRARFFITCKGRAMPGVSFNENVIYRNLISDYTGDPKLAGMEYEQLSLFDASPDLKLLPEAKTEPLLLEA